MAVDKGGQELMRLPKNEVAKLAVRARNQLKKNVSLVSERGQQVTHILTSLGGAGAMGAWNGMTRKAAAARGEDEMAALQYGGVDREAYVGGFLLLAGVGLSMAKGKTARSLGSIATGTGIGVGSMWLGNYVEERVAGG